MKIFKVRCEINLHDANGNARFESMQHVVAKDRIDAAKAILLELKNDQAKREKIGISTKLPTVFFVSERLMPEEATLLWKCKWDVEFKVRL